VQIDALQAPVANVLVSQEAFKQIYQLVVLMV
jgi:hypothetical protein